MSEKKDEKKPAEIEKVEMETSLEKNGPKVNMVFRKDALVKLAKQRKDADDLLIQGFKVAVLQNAIRGLMKAGIDTPAELLSIMNRKLVPGIEAAEWKDEPKKDEPAKE